MKMHAVDYVGSTPLVFLKNTSSRLQGNIFLKLEYLNPWLSVKDRIAKRIIQDAESSGRLLPGGHVIEATSGNTGISLAGVCAARGYKLTIVMPEFVSEERKLLLAMMGANLILTPESQGLIGPVAKSFELADADPNAFIVDQTRNPSNPAAHEGAGKEIWDQMQGCIDCFIAASGTGGHISGIGKFLKSQNANIEVIAVEPKEAAILSGNVKIGEANGNHGIVGIGPGFIPETLNRDIIDRVAVVDVESGYITAEKIIKEEGLLIGVSTGAVLSAACELASSRDYAGKNIVAVAASSTERYLSTKLTASSRQYVKDLVPAAASSKYFDLLLKKSKGA